MNFHRHFFQYFEYYTDFQILVSKFWPNLAQRFLSFMEIPVLTNSGFCRKIKMPASRFNPENNLI